MKKIRKRRRRKRNSCFWGRICSICFLPCSLACFVLWPQPLYLGLLLSTFLCLPGNESQARLLRIISSLDPSIPPPNKKNTIFRAWGDTLEESSGFQPVIMTGSSLFLTLKKKKQNKTPVQKVHNPKPPWLCSCVPNVSLKQEQMEDDQLSLFTQTG